MAIMNAKQDAYVKKAIYAPIAQKDIVDPILKHADNDFNFTLNLNKAGYEINMYRNSDYPTIFVVNITTVRKDEPIDLFEVGNTLENTFSTKFSNSQIRGFDYSAKTPSMAYSSSPRW